MAARPSPPPSDHSSAENLQFPFLVSPDYSSQTRNNKFSPASPASPPSSGQFSSGSSSSSSSAPVAPSGHSNGFSLSVLPSSNIDGIQLLMGWREGWLVFLMEAAYLNIKEDLTNAILQWARERAYNKSWPDIEPLPGVTGDSLLKLSRWVNAAVMKFDVSELKGAIKLACQQWNAERRHRKILEEENILLQEAQAEIARTRQAAEVAHREAAERLSRLEAEKEFLSDQFRTELSLLEMKNARDAEERMRLEAEQRSTQSQMKEMMEKAKSESSVCILCYVEPREFLFLPCKHACACHNCGSQVSRCPLCQQTIEAKERIFL